MKVKIMQVGPIGTNCYFLMEEEEKVLAIIDPGDEAKRIQAVAEKFERPFMFMECGCPSRDGSQYVPNNWNFGGELSQEAQRLWFDAFCQCMLKNPWVRGNGWWDWSAMWLYPREKAMENNGYCTYKKPSEQVLLAFSQQVAAREQNQGH